jgi:hypothetical protein
VYSVDEVVYRPASMGSTVGGAAAADGMTGDLPGFIPQVLRLDDVSLLRADETVFNAMVDGWRAQMLARGLDD